MVFHQTTWGKWHQSIIPGGDALFDYQAEMSCGGSNGWMAGLQHCCFIDIAWHSYAYTYIYIYVYIEEDGATRITQTRYVHLYLLGPFR